MAVYAFSASRAPRAAVRGSSGRGSAPSRKPTRDAVTVRAISDVTQQSKQAGLNGHATSVKRQPSTTVAPRMTVVSLRNGTYTGFADGGMRIDLRVDALEADPIPGRRVLNIVSLDLFAGNTYKVSMKSRSSDPLTVDESGINGVIREFALFSAEVQFPPGVVVSEGGTNWGRGYSISFDANAGVLTLQALSGNQQAVSFSMRYRSPYFREVDLEMDWDERLDQGGEESGPEFIAKHTLGMIQYFGKAGVDLRVNEGKSIGNPVQEPSDDQPGWSRQNLNDVLKTGFNNANAHRDWPTWSMYALIVPFFNEGTPGDEGVLGIMFDDQGPPFRQGFALFTDTVRSDRDKLFTLMHEAGHAFNLSHSFSPFKDKPRALSWMNYPQFYRTGPVQDIRALFNERAFWRDFSGVMDFDIDELEVIRHGDLKYVAPGEDAFGGFGPHYEFFPPRESHNHSHTH